jgi:hypothetical protein
MKPNFKAKYSGFFKRKFIKSNAAKLTYLQWLGLLLLTSCISLLFFICFLDFIFKPSDTLKFSNPFQPIHVSIIFFLIMLGIVLSFKDLLNDPSGKLNTMRLVLFMLSNVVCMLLLKTGWDKNTLVEVGLDGYWVAFILILIVAWFVQTYLHKSVGSKSESTPGLCDATFTNAEISRLAIIQNSDELLAKNPNIESISDTIKDGNSCVTIYLKDNITQRIPDTLNATFNNGTVVKVATEIIIDTGAAKPHIGQSTDAVSDTNSPQYYGSICCFVKSTTGNNFLGIVTAGHIFTYGDFFNYGGILSDAQKRTVYINNIPAGKLYFQQMKYNQDIAIIEIEAYENIFDNCISFDSEAYTVTDVDVNTAVENVTIVSRQNNTRHAFILDYNVSFLINYFNASRYVRNIVLIGSTNNRSTSQSVSHGGDSGSCVYNKANGKLIGLLLGGNNKFSFVLPIQETLHSFNFKTC